jgi:hypothetical protein
MSKIDYHCCFKLSAANCFTDKQSNYSPRVTGTSA